MVLIILLFSIITVLAGFKIIHKFYQYDHLEKYHNVTSYIFNAYGLLYAVVIAFVVFINWSDYNNAQEHLYLESNHISNMFHIAQGFQEPLRSDILKSIVSYTDYISTNEIVEMKNGKLSYGSNAEYNKLWDNVLKVNVKTLDNPYLYDQCIQEMNKISEYRRYRFFFLSNTIPQLIWVIMFLGCYFSFSFSFFFGMRSKFPYLYLVIGFTFINLILLYLIYVLDHPYEGLNAISYLPMEKIVIHFKDVINGIK
jgi:hypothetical protein